MTLVIVFAMSSDPRALHDVEHSNLQISRIGSTVSRCSNEPTPASFRFVNLDPADRTNYAFRNGSEFGAVVRGMSESSQLRSQP